jgi:hypothetical protein
MRSESAAGAGQAAAGAVIFAAGEQTHQPAQYEKTLEMLKRLCHDREWRVSFSMIKPLIDTYSAHNFYTEKIGAIDNLRMFYSGCGPVVALVDAKRRIERGESDVVAISGREMLGSLAGEPGGKQQILNTILQEGKGVPVYQYYHQMALRLCQKYEISPERFKELSDALFANYARTFQRRSGGQLPKVPDRTKPLPGASMFTPSDCAFPFVNFSGTLLVGTREVADTLGIAEPTEIRGVRVAITSEGPEYFEEILSGAHLKKTFENCCAEAGIDFFARYRRREAALQVYTCYPTVPLTFLLELGLARSVQEILPFLQEHEITINGGMSFHGAPWSCTALGDLIQLNSMIAGDETPLGIVHANGGLGSQQGFALLARSGL